MVPENVYLITDPTIHGNIWPPGMPVVRCGTLFLPIAGGTAGQNRAGSIANSGIKVRPLRPGERVTITGG